MKKMLIICLFALCVFLPMRNIKAQEKLELSLEAVMETALKYNLDLKLARITPEKEREKILLANSEFDPAFIAQTGILKQETYNEPVDSDTSQISGEAELSKKFKTGTQVSLNAKTVDNDVDMDQLDNMGGYYSAATLSVSHPVLKNNGRAVNLRNVTLAENAFKKARIALKQAVIDTISQAQNLYWQYFSAMEALGVYKQSLELARRFIEEVEEKVRIGSAARLDILQARAEVASREEEIITAKNTMQNARDSLLNYIYGHRRFRGSIICLTYPLRISRTWDEKELIDEALEKRTDYISAKLDLDSSDVDIIYYANQKKPELDVSLSLGINEGGAKSDLPASELFLMDQYNNYYYTQAVLSLKFPWGFRGEKANYGAARLGKKKVEVLLERIRSNIVLDVTTALRDLMAAGKRIDTTILASQYSRESLDAEQVKFRNGLSTSYNVLLYQRDLTGALVREVNATISYQNALITLFKAVGTTLEVNHIKVE